MDEVLTPRLCAGSAGPNTGTGYEVLRDMGTRTAFSTSQSPVASWLINEIMFAQRFVREIVAKALHL